MVPSHNESFGLVALEAQACGTPVVAAAVGGLPTAVRDGVSGLLVDGHDPADYAAAIERALGPPGAAVGRRPRRTRSSSPGSAPPTACWPPTAAALETAAAALPAAVSGA